MKLSSFITDPNKESNGVWCNAKDGLKLLIARAGNKAYREALKTRTQPIIRQLRHAHDQAEQILKLSMECAAKHILLGWKNLFEDDGTTEIPYSPEKALEVFKLSQDFYEMVLEFANDREMYLKAETEEAAGN